MKQVICIDFDGTLYKNEKIINRDKINALFENPNNFVVIYTARSWSQISHITQILREGNIKFHSICCEKLRADKYIDNLNEGGLKWK